MLLGSSRRLNLHRAILNIRYTADILQALLLFPVCSLTSTLQPVYTGSSSSSWFVIFLLVGNVRKKDVILLLQRINVSACSIQVFLRACEYMCVCVCINITIIFIDPK